MSAPISPSQVRPFATVRPPPTEKLALAYFTPLVAPTPVATRVPQPSKTEDTINGFLRVEAGGGVLRPDQIFFDVAVILHAYAPNTQESMAEELIDVAVAWGTNAQGYVQQLGADHWYVSYSRCTGLALRRADPYVNLTRYRAMVSWRVPGIPVTPGVQTWLQQPAAPAQPQAQQSQAPAQQAPRPSRRR